MKWYLDPSWRRTMMALAFTAAGMALTLFSVWLVWSVLHEPWPVTLAGQRLTIIGTALYIVLGLLGLVLTGLSMTVALRQVSGKFAGGEFSMSGGDSSAAGDQLKTAAAVTDAVGDALKGAG